MAFNSIYAPSVASPNAGSNSSEFWECGRCDFVNKTATDRVCVACGGAAPANVGNGISPLPTQGVQHHSAAPYVPQHPQPSAYATNHYRPAPAPAVQSAYVPATAATAPVPVPFSIPVHASAPPSVPPYGSAPTAAYVPATPSAPTNTPPPPVHASAPPSVPPYGSAPTAAYVPATPSAPTYTPPPTAPPVPAPQPQSQTVQVPVPPGIQPGQQLRVDIGTAGTAPVLVTVPDRSQWGGGGAQQFFHVRVPQPAASAPVVVQGTTVPVPTGHTGAYENSGGWSGGSAAVTAPSSSYGGTGTAAAPPASAHMAPIAPQLVSSSPRKLKLKEKVMSFTGDDASVKDESGNTIFRIKAEVMTMSQRRRLYDSSGQVLGQLRLKKSVGLRPTVYIGTPTNEKKCAVKMTGMLNPKKCNAHIFLGDNKIGRVAGNWRAKQFEVTIDDKTVATVSKKLTAASYFADADSYNINCEPGVDLAFVALVVISLDELYNDEN